MAWHSAVMRLIPLAANASWYDIPAVRVIGAVAKAQLVKAIDRVLT